MKVNACQRSAGENLRITSNSDYLNPRPASFGILELVIGTHFWGRPKINPAGILRSKVNTPMAADAAKAIMPIRTVKGVSALGKVGNPRHSWKIVAAECAVPGHHVLGWAFQADQETAGGGLVFGIGQVIPG